MSSLHHVIPTKTYLKVLLVLLGLTVLTVAVARPVTGVDFGFLNTAIAMFIATIKASLVLAIFMHLKYDNKLFTVIFGTSLFFLIILYLFSLIDIYSRVPEANSL